MLPWMNYRSHMTVMYGFEICNEASGNWKFPARRATAIVWDLYNTGVVFQKNYRAGSDKVKAMSPSHYREGSNESVWFISPAKNFPYDKFPYIHRTDPIDYTPKIETPQGELFTNE